MMDKSALGQIATEIFCLLPENRRLAHKVLRLAVEIVNEAYGEEPVPDDETLAASYDEPYETYQ